MPSPQLIQQQIQIIQTKLIHLQQQLQQVHQMSLGPIGPDQLHSIQMKQQELLRVQQLMTQQLNQLNQMHRLSMVQQRNLNITTRPNMNQMQYPGMTLMQYPMNQIQNPVIGNQLRNITPQAFAAQQQLTQQQFNVFQGQSRPFMQNTMANNNSNISSLSRTQAQSSYPSDFHGSPKGTTSQVGTPQAANSPADTIASNQIGPASPPKHNYIEKSSQMNSSIHFVPSTNPLPQNHTLPLTSSNQQTQNSHCQNLNNSTSALNENESTEHIKAQTNNSEPQTPSNMPSIKTESNYTKEGRYHNVKSNFFSE